MGDRKRIRLSSSFQTPSAHGDAGDENGEFDHSFKEGAIVRIKLENILTYDSVEFYTGPSLNVIIGPNGTGKSAIVCAICLGLAGKTGWLGRASNAADFVKYNADRGSIELELYNCDGENYVIRREITRLAGKATSNWWVNGRAANLKSVEEMVTRLSIQVGNLVQFLPQEKVADFARMSQQELLDSTQKAVGSAEMCECHQRLINMGEESQNMDKRLESLRKDLQLEEQKNSRLQADVKNFKERAKFLDNVDMMKKKKPWLEYHLLKKDFEEQKERRDEKERELKQAHRQHEPLRRKVDKLAQDKATLDTQLKTKTTNIRENANKVSESSHDIEKLDDKIQEAKADLEMKIQEEDKRRKKLEDLTAQLSALVTEMTQAQGDNDNGLLEEIQTVNEHMRQLTQEINTIHQRGIPMSSEISKLRRQREESQNQLRHIQDVGNQRLEQLRQSHRPTYNAVMWLRQNKHRFKANIYEPMILCVHMNDPNHAKFIETHINENDLRAFVIEDPDDTDLFLRLMKDEQKLRVNAVKAPTQPVHSFKPRYPISQIEQYGFFSYLKDLFQCPEPVMAYLCLQYRVHMIPVGSDQLRRNVETVLKTRPEINQFYTDSLTYSIRRSKYNGAVSTRSAPLKDVRYFRASMDTKREEEIQHVIRDVQRNLEEMEINYHQLQEQQKGKERDLNTLRDQKRQLQMKKDQKKRLEQQIQTKRESIRRVEREAIDVDAEEQNSKVKVKRIIRDKAENLAKMHSHSQKCFELTKAKVGESLRQAEVVRKHGLLEARLQQQTQGLQALEKEVEGLRQSMKDAKQVAREKLEEAKKATSSNGREELPPNIKLSFDRYPNTLEELDDEIHRLQARADSIYQIDETVIQRYYAREKEIANMRVVLDQKEKEEREMKGRVSTLRDQWLTPLNQLIARINENFTRFFSAMDCAGEVDLSEPEDKENYKNYGVRIRVKFRDGDQLRELTSSYQSGGERSVATVLYMMALQELARCPFRCVDEINQGMDPVNERKVFELVVQTVCRRNAAQYFLLTPKLLPDLKYAENMTVLCVNNGPIKIHHSQWDLAAFIRKGEQIN